ncbi:DNA binding domain-containing protein, excisionase family [Clostridium amylolyticum]|uniref:DNA binding domain-containing protein, excisionase family n=1 Tax=Clostridium amylolyticum TaxID=1121298 RepID=A0A1M6F0L4_9CLOT|nr:excisionase [Clostridium amylolyticum]SHI91232.1 DNA binding domain-containing protein, excisionase family [Clostridium amylolyticum]
MELTIDIIKAAITEAIRETKPKATLTIAECVAYTGIGRDKLMELAHSQNSGFPAFRVGAKFLVNRELLDMWLENITKEKRVL